MQKLQNNIRKNIGIMDKYAEIMKYYKKKIQKNTEIMNKMQKL